MDNIQKDNQKHADAKHAKRHAKELVEENAYLELDKSHKDWYMTGEMGKQRNKPKSTPKENKKEKKSWKHK